MFQHDGNFRPLPDWAKEIKLFPKKPGDDYYIRMRILGVAREPGSEQVFASCRKLMTDPGTHAICPRGACKRTKACASEYACCLFENIEEMQKYVFPAMKRMAANNSTSPGHSRKG